MKRIPCSFLTAFYMFLTVQGVPRSSSIWSFSVTSWNTRTSSWVRDSHMFPREDVKLECTKTEFSQVNELHITRADGFPLSVDHTIDIQKDNQSLMLILKSVECSDMGTYVCQNGPGDKKTVDLGIYDCPPRPCKDQSTNITLYVSVNKTTQFSVCVEAFPGVSSLFFFNGMEVRFNRTNEFPGVTCTQNKLREVFSTYNISCTITVSDEKNYTFHDFSIPSGTAQNQIVKFSVQIKKPGPPECPTRIISTNQAEDYVTLSWQPVNNRGGSQTVTYTIFYTANDTEWQRYSTVEDTQTTISSLQSDTVYEFRVISANEYSHVINENTCTTTVEVKTAPTSTIIPSKDAVTTTTTTTTTTKETTKDNNTSDELTILSVIIAILSVLAVLTVIAAVVQWNVDCIFKRLRSRARTSWTLSFHSNERHVPETTQQTLLFNFGNSSHLPNQNIYIEESMY